MKFFLFTLIILSFNSLAIDHKTCVIENYKKDKRTRELFKKIDSQPLFNRGYLFVKHGQFRPSFEIENHSQKPLRIRISQYEKREEHYSIETKFKRRYTKICQLELILESPTYHKNEYQIESKQVAKKTRFVGLLGDRTDCSQNVWEDLRDQLIEQLPECHKY